MFSPLLTASVKLKSILGMIRVGSRLIAGLLFLLLPISLLSCALIPTGQLPQKRGGPAKAMVEDVPFFAQEKLQCGPAALAMALNWSGTTLQPSDLTAEVFSPELEGSLQSAMINATRKHGRVAYPISGSEALLEELSAGNPVIVLVNLSFFWYPKWHYAVVIGYDQQQGEVVLHSGLNAGEVLSSRTFMNIWRRSEYWGLLVLPPDRLPAGGKETKWLAAVAGLEKAGQWQAAAIGYDAALTRWNSFAAWMGLGNSRYRLNELNGSAEAFRQATLLQPENGMAFNNLAHVLSEQGKQQEALAAARRAVELGGPFVATFRQTFEEIKLKKRQ